MSFNPNFIPPNDLPGDEPEFDGNLPADFAALGEQLQADAQRLSSVYPACQPPTKLMAALAVASEPRFFARQWSRRKLLAVITSAAAAVLLAIGLITVAVSPEVLRIAHEHPATKPEGSNIAVPLVSNLPDAKLPAAAELQPVSFRPAVIDVTGPELEGLLDLWQEQPPAEGSISF